MLKNAELKTTIVLENGNKFKIDWENGQKTGFFIDQRENRKFLGEMSKGKYIKYFLLFRWIFNLCFNSGAKEVHSLDSSQKAIDLVDENIELIAKR